MKTKFCKKCLETKEVTEFYKQKSMKDGRQNTCKVCIRERSRQWRIDNPKPKKTPKPRMDGFRLLPKGMRKCSTCKEVKEKELFYKDRGRASGVSPKCKKCTNEYLREKRKSPHRPDLEVRRKWTEENREKLRQQNREYRSANLLKHSINQANRRTRKEELPNTLTHEETVEILKTFEYKCSICEEDYEHLDHFIPISSGHGGTTKENIVPMCASCNISKRDTNPFEWGCRLDNTERDNFETLVQHLTVLNGIASESEYKAYVENCFK